MENCSVACPRIIKGGGGQKSERIFFGYSIFQGGGGTSSENDVSD